jgi:hypothetical protein
VDGVRWIEECRGGRGSSGGRGRGESRGESRGVSRGESRGESREGGVVRGIASNRSC